MLNSSTEGWDKKNTENGYNMGPFILFRTPNKYKYICFDFESVILITISRE